MLNKNCVFSTQAVFENCRTFKHKLCCFFFKVFSHIEDLLSKNCAQALLDIENCETYFISFSSFV